jgi:hypothetical protein
MVTLDPATNGIVGWEAFLDAYNTFCITHHGQPLFNQAPRVTPEQARISFGEEIAVFQKFRREFDPTNRLYSRFFQKLFG